jgi:hypothetical protein
MSPAVEQFMADKISFTKDEWALLLRSPHECRNGDYGR